MQTKQFSQLPAERILKKCKDAKGFFLQLHKKDISLSFKHKVVDIEKMFKEEAQQKRNGEWWELIVQIVGGSQIDDCSSWNRSG